jgi:hypothetical protein
MNINKRVWALDSTDINRMFPGYDKGETTQRIAAALFSLVKDYTFGTQLASFYLHGDFVPHVPVLNTGYQDEKAAIPSTRTRRSWCGRRRCASSRVGARGDILSALSCGR